MSRGATLVEAIIALALIAIAFGVLIGTLMTEYRAASGGRNRILAVHLAESTLEEIHDHRYGAAAPASWGTASRPSQNPVEIVSAGQAYTITLNRYVESAADKGGNGSFFDSTKSDSGDVLRINIEWSESLERTTSSKTVEAFVTVWRQDVTTRNL